MHAINVFLFPVIFCKLLDEGAHFLSENEWQVDNPRRDRWSVSLQQNNEVAPVTQRTHGAGPGS